MGAASNYLERGKWFCSKLLQLAILSIVINIFAIYNGLPYAYATRKSEASKISRRDWDSGDTHVTSPYLSSAKAKANTSSQVDRSTNDIKQRKMQPYPTSYSIINSTKIEPETTIDLLFRKGQASAGYTENGINSDFYRNLEALKKVVRARQELVKQQQNPDVDRESDIRGANSSTSKLEDNIDTINVLIGMLMLANSKLIEQRDKIAPSSSLKKIRDLYSNLREDKKGNSGKLEESLASSPITSQAEPKTFKNTSILQDQNNSTVKLTKLSRFKPNKRVMNLKRPLKAQNVTENTKEVNPADYFSDGPGFDSDDATHLRNNISEKNVPSEAQYSGALFANPALIGKRNDFLRNHKPIVAHDLLHVRPHKPDPAIYVPNRHLRPENMFVSHIPIRAQPFLGIYEHLNPNRLSLGHEVDQRGLVHSMKRLPYEENSKNFRDEEQQQQQQQRMVPPYNVHNVDWPPSTTSNPYLAQNQFNEHPILQRLGEEQEYNLTPKPTIYPAIHNNPHQNSIKDNELRNQQGFISPLHQVLIAARNQQALALDQERRRLLEHEMELQNRQQQMKQQHEDNLIKQKLAHEERQKSAQNNEQQRQQNLENQQQSGPENSEDQGSQQGQQQQQQQDQPQGGGAQDQSDDPGSGDGDENISQQGGNEDKNGSDPREDDMKNFRDFAGDTDFTDLFPPGILSDAEIKEMRKQHQEQKQQREQEEQEERDRQRQGSEEEEEEEEQGGNGGEDNSGQQQVGQQDIGEQTEQNNRTQGEEMQKQPESSLGEKKNSTLILTNNSTYDVSSINNHTMVKPQVIEPKYNVTTSQNSLSKSEGKVGSLVKHESLIGKTPRLFVPNFLNNNSSLNSSLIGHADRSTLTRLDQQPVTNKRRRSHHNLISPKGMLLSHVENNELLPNGMTFSESEYQNKYVKPFMSTMERNNNNEYHQEEPTQATSISGDEDVAS